MLLNQEKPTASQEEAISKFDAREKRMQEMQSEGGLSSLNSSMSKNKNDQLSVGDRCYGG